MNFQKVILYSPLVAIAALATFYAGHVFLGNVERPCVGAEAAAKGEPNLAPPLWVHPTSGCVFVIDGEGPGRRYTQIEGPDGYAVCNTPAPKSEGVTAAAPAEAGK